MPWIVVEFIRLFVSILLIVLTIVLWVIYMDASADTTFIIALGVIGIIIISKQAGIVDFIQEYSDGLIYKY